MFSSPFSRRPLNTPPVFMFSSCSVQFTRTCTHDPCGEFLQPYVRRTSVHDTYSLQTQHACATLRIQHQVHSPHISVSVSHMRGVAVRGTAHLIIRYQHCTPLIDAAPMPIVTKLAPSPPCDGCYASWGAAKSSNRARSFCTLAPSSAPGPNPSCIHYRRVAVGAQATLSPSPLPHPHRQR